MNRYPLRYRVWLGVALLHLLLVALGASYAGYSCFGPLSPLFDYYGSISGSGDSYGFFAPGVSGQIRALFDVYDAQGRKRTVTLQTGASHEADLRVGNIIEQFTNDDVDDPEALKRSLAASLASTVFYRNADARQVAVRLESFYPVSMAEYRAGRRPQWSPEYEAKFEAGRGEGDGP